MGYRREPFAPEEWYHVYNRGIDKRDIFYDTYDFQRFKKLLYLANGTDDINFELLKDIPYADIFMLPRGNSLVAMGAFCLMNNHPHLVLQEKKEGGITAFMHKLGTAYTSYFNRRHDRIGNLMVKPFRSKHIDTDGYLHRVVQYVHLNSAEIFEPGWKEGRVTDIKALEEKLLDYKHSSLPDYFGSKERPEKAILDVQAYDLLKDNLPELGSILTDAAAYYEETSRAFDPQPRGPKTKTTLLS